MWTTLIVYHRETGIVVRRSPTSNLLNKLLIEKKKRDFSSLLLHYQLSRETVRRPEVLVCIHQLSSEVIRQPNTCFVISVRNKVCCSNLSYPFSIKVFLQNAAAELDCPYAHASFASIAMEPYFIVSRI
jgi:hypothetical protein